MDIADYVHASKEGNKIFCCFCGVKIQSYGNNPDPIADGSEYDCCARCNREVVVPIREYLMHKHRRSYSMDVFREDQEAQNMAIDLIRHAGGLR